MRQRAAEVALTIRAESSIDPGGLVRKMPSASPDHEDHHDIRVFADESSPNTRRYDF